MAHVISGVEQRQRAADHHRGVLLRRHEDMGAHGGGGGLSVGARDTQGVGIAAHDGAPGLGAFIDGDMAGDSAGNLRIIVVNGGRADDQITLPQIFGVVAHSHRDTQGAQVLHCGAVIHIRTLDMQPHALENLRQRAHGNASDPC